MSWLLESTNTGERVVLLFLVVGILILIRIMFILGKDRLVRLSILVLSGLIIYFVGRNLLIVGVEDGMPFWEQQGPQIAEVAANWVSSPETTKWLITYFGWMVPCVAFLMLPFAWMLQQAAEGGNRSQPAARIKARSAGARQQVDVTSAKYLDQVNDMFSGRGKR